MATDDMNGVGLDVGTMTIVGARRDVSKKKIAISRVRNAFLDLPLENKRMLKLSNTGYVELDGKLLVIGDEALQTANLFNREARRPMAGGLMASGEIDAQRIIALMIKQVLGAPKKAGEKCCYSVPAAAIDQANSDVIYHAAILKKVIGEIGYTPEPTNEALAVVFSECQNEGFSGCGFSFGAGMSNIALGFNAMSALEFSVGRGGDWIDAGAAKAVGTTSAKICAVKEAGIDIANPKGHEAEAIGLYVQSLIDYTITKTIEFFQKRKGEIHIGKALPIVISGGTSLAGGFLTKFKERFEVHRGKFPIEVSEIRAAADPMTAVATGLLLLAQMDDGLAFF